MQHLRAWGFQWAGLGMHSYTSPDAEKGSTPSDGGEVTQFKSLSYTSSNGPIKDYYTSCYSSIVLSNEALVIANSLADSVVKKKTYIAEALFLRSVMYYRLAQAFGGVPYITTVLGAMIRFRHVQPVSRFGVISKKIYWWLFRIYLHA